MRIITLIAAFLVACCVYSQDQKGYYIDHNGQKTEGYFKTTDFHEASSLQFKTLPDGDFEKLAAEEITEYGIDGQYKFVKHTVKIDKSDSNYNKLSRTKDPEWQDATLFLNVIIEGNATLYSYQSKWGTKYFFSVQGDDQPKQLIYKKYKPTEISLYENNHFRQQLFNYVKCEGQLLNEFLDVKYERKELANIFRTYNLCLGSTSRVFFNATSQTTGIKLTVFAGASNLVFYLDNFPRTFSKSNSVGYNAGLEAALILPSETLEFFLRVEFEKGEGEVINYYDQGYNVLTTKFKFDSDMFNIHLGPRYNFLINERNKIFIDASLSVSLPFGTVVESSSIRSNSGIEYDGDGRVYDLSSTFGGNFGAGYVFNKKWGIDIRYETNRNMFTNIDTKYTTKISRLGFNVRYTIN